MGAKGCYLLSLFNSSINAMSVFFLTGWLEPLLDRIHRDSTTVVCPVIDVIDDDTMEYHYSNAAGTSVGGFDWNLQVNAPDSPRHFLVCVFLYLIITPQLSLSLATTFKCSVMFY